MDLLFLLLDSSLVVAECCILESGLVVVEMWFEDRAMVVVEVWILFVDCTVVDQSLLVDRTLVLGSFLKCIVHKYYHELYNLDHIFCSQWPFYTLMGIFVVEEVQL